MEILLIIFFLTLFGKGCSLDKLDEVLGFVIALILLGLWILCALAF